MNAIQSAQILKEELDSLRPISKENELRIMQKFRLDWNYHSNNLEGNSLTYGETKALILFGITAQGKPFKDHLEMTGHDEAVKWIEEVVKEERPLTQNFIRDLHTLLLKEPYQVDAITPAGEPTKKWVTVGEYKKTPNHVQTKTGEIFRFAMPEETPAKMTDLVDWFQQEKEKEDYNAIITAIEFHYRFIRIHPFDDGNGRTARILMNFILMQSGYPPVIIKTGEKQEYIAALEQADAGLFDPFINYIADNLCKSIELMIKGAKGESVEEEDDIDKEIKLLDLKLQQVGRKFEKGKSKETILEFAENVMRKIFDCFVESVLPFKNYFQVFSIILPIPNSDYSFQSVFNPDENYFNEILKILKEQKTDNSFRISVVFEGLKYVSLEKERVVLTLNFFFENSFVQFTTADYLISFLYTDDIDESELKKFGKAVKQKGLDEINYLINH